MVEEKIINVENLRNPMVSLAIITGVLLVSACLLLMSQVDGVERMRGIALFATIWGLVVFLPGVFIDDESAVTTFACLVFSCGMVSSLILIPT